MSKTVPRQCKIFNCDRRHGNICCADCGYRKNQCSNPCLNHPSRCGQVSGVFSRKGKTAKGG